MKIAMAVGSDFRKCSVTGFNPNKIYSQLKENNLEPDFILFYFPISNPLELKELNKKKLLKKIIQLLPVFLLKIIFWRRIPRLNTKIYFIKGINSKKSLKVLAHEKPNIVITYNCGIVGKKICETYHNVFLNAHAGDLPEYRGMNNVEWAYLEDKPLIGTIHFIARGIDTGDVLYQDELIKESKPISIEQIRKKAFKQVFDLFVKAIKSSEKENIYYKKQPNKRTTRYVMHPFLLKVLEKNLGLFKIF